MTKIEYPYSLIQTEHVPSQYSLKSNSEVNEWLKGFNSSDFTMVPATEELSNFGTFRFGLLAIAALTMPTGMYYSAHLANEAYPIYRAVDEMDIQIPAEYIPHTKSDLPATQQWLEDEKVRLIQEGEDDINLDERRNNAVGLAVVGALSNIAAIVPNFLKKSKSSPNGKFDFIDTHSSFGFKKRKT